MYTRIDRSVEYRTTRKITYVIIRRAEGSIRFRFAGYIDWPLLKHRLLLFSQSFPAYISRAHGRSLILHAFQTSPSYYCRIRCFLFFFSTQIQSTPHYDALLGINHRRVLSKNVRVRKYYNIIMPTRTFTEFLRTPPDNGPGTIFWRAARRVISCCRKHRFFKELINRYVKEV